MKSSGGHMGGFPMRKSTMPRKMDVSAALKGLNQRAPVSSMGGGFRRPILNRPNAGRKSEGGGVKLLDITEQPVNAMARKRKRQQELEEAAAEKKKAQEQRAAEKQVSRWTVDWMGHDFTGQKKIIISSFSLISTLNFMKCCNLSERERQINLMSDLNFIYPLEDYG